MTTAQLVTVALAWFVPLVAVIGCFLKAWLAIDPLLESEWCREHLGRAAKWLAGAALCGLLLVIACERCG